MGMHVNRLDCRRTGGKADDSVEERTHSARFEVCIVVKGQDWETGHLNSIPDC